MKTLFALLLAGRCLAGGFAEHSLPPTLDGAYAMMRDLMGRAPAFPRNFPAAAKTPGYLSGSGSVSGSGSLQCSSHTGSGHMGGHIFLRGTISVSGDGIRGSIPVSGSVYLSGSCTNGQGFANGTAYLDGSGPVQGAGGRTRQARISGQVFINKFVTSNHVWLNEHASFSGRAD